MRKSFSSGLILTVLMLFTISACGNKENAEPDNNKPVAGFHFIDEIDRFSLVDTSADEDGDELTAEWEVIEGDVKIEKASDTYYFMLPKKKEESIAVIKLTVSDGKDYDSVTKTITIPELGWHREYLIGTDITEGISNNVDYDWYIDQCDTGYYSDINCGPSSTTMAIKWAKPDYTGTAEDAREYYLPGLDGWWSTGTIYEYLGLNDVKRKYIDFKSAETLAEALSTGSIAILCLDIFYVRTAENIQWRLDKYYSTYSPGAGHFIVVKGYRIVDGDELFFEVYDPWGEGKRYDDDNSVMGIDRLYRAEDIMKASDVWWKYAIIVSKAGAGLAEYAPELFLDPATVPVQWGK